MKLEFEYCVGNNYGMYKYNFSQLTRKVTSRDEVLEHYRLLRKVFDLRYGKGPKLNVGIPHYHYNKDGSRSRLYTAFKPLGWLKQAEKEIRERLELPTEVVQMLDTRDNITWILERLGKDLSPYVYAFEYRDTSSGRLLVRSLEDIYKLTQRTIRRAYNHATNMHEYVARSKRGLDPEENKEDKP